MDRLTWLLVFIALGTVCARSYVNLDNLQLKVPVTLKLVSGHFQPVFDREALTREANNVIRTALTQSSANSEKSGGFHRVSDQPSESEREEAQSTDENAGESAPSKTVSQGTPRHVNDDDSTAIESEPENRAEIVQPKRKAVNPARLIRYLQKILKRLPKRPTTEAPIAEPPATEAPITELITDGITNENDDSSNDAPLETVQPKRKAFNPNGLIRYLQRILKRLPIQPKKETPTTEAPATEVQIIEPVTEGIASENDDSLYDAPLETVQHKRKANSAARLIKRLLKILKRLTNRPPKEAPITEAPATEIPIEEPVSEDIGSENEDSSNDAPLEAFQPKRQAIIINPAELIRYLTKAIKTLVNRVPSGDDTTENEDSSNDAPPESLPIQIKFKKPVILIRKLLRLINSKRDRSTTEVPITEVDLAQSIIGLLQEISDVFATHFQHNTQIQRLIEVLRRLIDWQGQVNEKAEILIQLKKVGEFIKEYKQSLLENPSLVEESFDIVKNATDVLKTIERNKKLKPFDVLLIVLSRFLEAQGRSTEAKTEETNDTKQLYVQLIKTLSNNFERVQKILVSQVGGLSKAVSEFKRENRKAVKKWAVESTSDLLNLFANVLKSNIDKVPSDFLKRFIELSEMYFNKDDLSPESHLSPDQDSWRIILTKQKYKNFAEILATFIRTVHSNEGVVPTSFVNKFDALYAKFRKLPSISSQIVPPKEAPENDSDQTNPTPSEGFSELRVPSQTDQETNQAAGKEPEKEKLSSSRNPLDELREILTAEPSTTQSPIDELKDLQKSRVEHSWNPIDELKELLRHKELEKQRLSWNPLDDLKEYLKAKESASKSPIDELKDLQNSKNPASSKSIDEQKELIRQKLPALDLPIDVRFGYPRDDFHEGKEKAPKNVASSDQSRQNPTESHKNEGETPSNIGLTNDKLLQSETKPVKMDEIVRESTTSLPSPNENHTTAPSPLTPAVTSQNVEETTTQPSHPASVETTTPKIGQEPTKGPSASEEKANDNVTTPRNEKIEEVTKSPSTTEKPAEPAKEPVTEKPNTVSKEMSELVKTVKEIAEKVTTLVNNTVKSRQNSTEDTAKPKKPIDEMKELFKPFYESVMNMLKNFTSEAKSTDMSSSQPSDLFKPVWNLVDNLKNLLGNNVLPALGSENTSSASQEKPTESLSQMIDNILQSLKIILKKYADKPVKPIVINIIQPPKPLPSNETSPVETTTKSPPPPTDDKLNVIQQTMQKILENIQKMNVKKPVSPIAGLLENIKAILGDDFEKFTKSAVTNLLSKLYGNSSPSAPSSEANKGDDAKKAIEDLKSQAEHYKQLFQSMYKKVSDLLKQKPVPFIDSLSSALDGLNNILHRTVKESSQEGQKIEGDVQKPTTRNMLVEAIRRVVKNLYASLENISNAGSDTTALSIVKTITAIQKKLNEALDAITRAYSRLSPKIFKDTFLEVLTPKKTEPKQAPEKDDPYQLPGKVYKVVHDIMDENPDDENNKFFKYFTRLYKKIGYSLDEKPEEFVHLFVESVLQLSYKIPQTLEKYIVRFYRIFKDIYASVSDKLKAGHTDDFLKVLNKLSMRLNYTLGKRSEKSFKKEFVRMWYEKFDNNFNDIYHYFSEKGSLEDQQEYAGRIYRKAKTVSLVSIDNYPDEAQQLNKLLEEKIGSTYADNDPKLNERFMRVYKQMHRDLKDTLDGYLTQYYALFVRVHEVIKKEELAANEEDFIKLYIVSSRELFGSNGKLFFRNSKYFQPYFYRAWRLAVTENESNKVHDEVSQEADTAKNSTDKIGQLIDELFDESIGIPKDEYKKIFLKLYELFGSKFGEGLSKNVNHFIRLYRELTQTGEGNADDLSRLLTRIFRIVFVEKSFNYAKSWKSLNDYVISYWQKHLRDASATALHSSLLETLNKVRPFDHLASSLYYDKSFLLKLANVKLIDSRETLNQYLDANRILAKNLDGQYQALPAEATYLFVKTYVGLKNVLGTVVDNNLNTIFSVYQIVYTPDDSTIFENRKEFVETLVKTVLNHIGQNGAGPKVAAIIVRHFNEEWKNFIDHKSNVKRVLGVISTHDFSAPRILEPPPRPPTVLVIRPAPIEPAPIPIPRPVVLNLNYLQRIPTYLIPTVRHIATNYFPGLESKLYETTYDILQQNSGILNQTPYEILRHLVAVYSHRFNSPSLLDYLPDILNYHSMALSKLNKKIDNVDQLYGKLYKRLSDNLGHKLEKHSKRLRSIVRKLYRTVKGKLKQKDFIDTFVDSYKKLKEVFGSKVEPTIQNFAPQFINFSNSMDHYEINKNINVSETKEQCCTPAPTTTTPATMTNENSEEERTPKPKTPTTPTMPETPKEPAKPEEPVTPAIPVISTPEPDENKTESHISGDFQTGQDVFNVSKHTDHFHNTSEKVMKESQRFQDVFFDVFNMLHDKDHDFDRHSEDLYDILKQINLLYHYDTMEDTSFKKLLVKDFNETYVIKSMGNRSDDFHVLRRLSKEYQPANLVEVVGKKMISSVPVQIISKMIEYGFDQICLAYASNDLGENIGKVFFNNHNNKTLADLWFGKLMELYGTCFIDFTKSEPGKDSELYMSLSSQDRNLQALFFRTWYVMLATEAAKLSDHGEMKTIYSLLLKTYTKLKEDNIPLDSSSADFIYIFTNFYRFYKKRNEDLSSPGEAAEFVEKVTEIYTNVFKSRGKPSESTSSDQSSAYKALLDRFGAIYPKVLRNEQAQSNFKTFFDTFYRLYEDSRYNQDLFVDALTDPTADIPTYLKKSLVSLFRRGVQFNMTYDYYYRLYDLPWHSVEYVDAQKYFAASGMSKVFDHIMKELHDDYGHMYDYDLSFIKDFLLPLHQKYLITDTNRKNVYEAFMRVFTQTMSKNEKLSQADFLAKIQLELKDEVNSEENTPEYKEFSKLYEKLNIKTISREIFIKYSKMVKTELGDDWDIQSYENGFQTAFSTGRKVEYPYPIEFWKAYDVSYLKIKKDWRGLEYANALRSLKNHPTQLNPFQSIFQNLYEEKGQDAFYLADFIKNVIRRIDGLLKFNDFVSYFLDFFRSYTAGYNDVTAFTTAVETFFMKALDYYRFKITTSDGKTFNATYIENCDDKDGHPIFFKGYLERQQRKTICKEHTVNDTYTEDDKKKFYEDLLKQARIERGILRKA